LWKAACQRVECPDLSRLCFLNAPAGRVLGVCAILFIAPAPFKGGVGLGWLGFVLFSVIPPAPFEGGWGDEKRARVVGNLCFSCHPPCPLQRGSRARVVGICAFFCHPPGPLQRGSVFVFSPIESPARSHSPFEGGWGDEDGTRVAGNLCYSCHPPCPLQRGSRARVVWGFVLFLDRRSVFVF